MTSPAGRDRAAVIDDAFSGMQRWGLRIVVIAATVFVLGWIVGELWVIIFPVIVALIVSTVLVPAVTWLRDRRVPSGLASAMVVIGFLAVVVGIIAALTPQVAGQAPELADSAARGLQKV